MSYAESVSYRSYRASNADRDRAVDSLRAAYAEGRLDDGEFHRRVDEVLRSLTYGELERLTNDIPNGPTPPAIHAARYLPVPVPTSGRAVATLALGVGGWVSVGPLAWIPAVVIGRQARRDIRNGQARGEEITTIGLAAAWTGLALSALVVVLFGTLFVELLRHIF